jgi:hypothetical protein
MTIVVFIYSNGNVYEGEAPLKEFDADYMACINLGEPEFKLSMFCLPGRGVEHNPLATDLYRRGRNLMMARPETRQQINWTAVLMDDNGDFTLERYRAWKKLADELHDPFA